MPGLVSLLDEAHAEKLVALWEELDRAFGVRGIYKTPFPHFSYQVAEKYHVEALEAALARLVTEEAPFIVEAAGLGVFTGQTPVLYIPVVRTPNLDRMHRLVWAASDGLVLKPLPYYEAKLWLPHITLGDHDVTPENLPDLVRFLAARTFNWEMTVDNLAFIDEGPDGINEVHFRLNFGGGKSNRE